MIPHLSPALLAPGGDLLSPTLAQKPAGLSLLLLGPLLKLQVNNGLCHLQGRPSLAQGALYVVADLRGRVGAVGGPQRWLRHVLSFDCVPG